MVTNSLVGEVELCKVAMKFFGLSISSLRCLNFSSKRSNVVSLSFGRNVRLAFESPWSKPPINTYESRLTDSSPPSITGILVWRRYAQIATTIIQRIAINVIALLCSGCHNAEHKCVHPNSYSSFVAFATSIKFPAPSQRSTPCIEHQALIQSGINDSVQTLRQGNQSARFPLNVNCFVNDWWFIFRNTASLTCFCAKPHIESTVRTFDVVVGVFSGGLSGRLLARPCGPVIRALHGISQYRVRRMAALDLQLS
jgi:hypothetical protein